MAQHSAPTLDTAPTATPAVTSASVTTAGGLAERIPVFTGAATLDNSVLYQTSTGIGIGRYPNATLDVGGNSTTAESWASRDQATPPPQTPAAYPAWT